MENSLECSFFCNFCKSQIRLVKEDIKNRANHEFVCEKYQILKSSDFSFEGFGSVISDLVPIPGASKKDVVSQENKNEKTVMSVSHIFIIKNNFQCAFRNYLQIKRLELQKELVVSDMVNINLEILKSDREGLELEEEKPSNLTKYWLFSKDSELWTKFIHDLRNMNSLKKENKFKKRNFVIRKRETS